MLRSTNIGGLVAGLILVAALCNSIPCSAVVQDSPRDPLVIFLVRHAEKTDAGRDPELSDAGKARAGQLLDFLRDANLQQIHSSDYIRTRDTAEPLATHLDLKVKLYDPRKMPDLIEQLKQTGGRHLVVGHSNTTPAAVKLLGGEAGTAIDEGGEYDRLYVIAFDSNGQATTLLLRYGKPFQQRN